MLYPKVSLDESQRALIAEAFQEICSTIRLQVYAIAILPDHVHFVSARHREDIEALIGFLKRAASRVLTASGKHPLARYAKPDGSNPTIWVRGGWKRILNSPADIECAIEYVRKNPIRAQLPLRRYDWETPFRWERTSRSRDG